MRERENEWKGGLRGKRGGWGTEREEREREREEEEEDLVSVSRLPGRDRPPPSHQPFGSESIIKSRDSCV